MFLFAAAAAVAIIWLWLLPPEGLSSRARLLWIGCLALTAAISTWMTAGVMNAANGARQRALENARRVQAEKDRYLDRARDGLGPAAFTRPDAVAEFEKR